MTTTTERPTPAVEAHDPRVELWHQLWRELLVKAEASLEERQQAKVAA
jgi:hypothetical protein